MSESITIRIPLAPMPKARPRRASWGGVHMPEEYLLWSDAFRDAARRAMAAQGAQQIAGPCLVLVVFYGPRRPRGDPDNLLGGVLDAIQPSRKDPDPVVIGNDCHVRYPLIVDYHEAPDWETEVIVSPVEEPRRRRVRR